MTAHDYTPPWRRGAGYVGLILFGLIFIGPFLIQLATSFKTDADAASNSLSLIPHPVTYGAWERIFGFTDNAGIPFGRWLTNSIIVATFITLGRVFIDSLAGYALARLRFPGRQGVFWSILAVLAVPGAVLLIPRFLVLKELTLFNTYPGMILPIIADAAGIFLMRQFFIGIPQTMEEAARIDGAGVFRTYWTVILPLARPGLITLTILSFQGSWNEFQLFLVATSDPKYNTLTTGLAKFSSGQLGSGTQYPLTLGAALLSTVPVAIVFFAFQRHFIGGQLSAAVKG